MYSFIILAVAASIAASSVVQTPEATDGSLELIILHNNDMHARFEQTSQLSGVCTTADREAGKCYGGFARVATVVKKAREEAASGQGPPVLYLNAGDTYSGSAWFTLYKWKIAAEFVNALNPDAVSLGNHEFDERVDGVVPFIRNLSAPVLAANLKLEKVPELQNETNLMKSVVLTVNGVKIGVIGYLTPETRFLAPKNDVEYEEEISAIREEVKKLQAQNITILIALGHSGYPKDLEIAQEVDGLDLVIGGHTNTFLTNTAFTEPEKSEGPYPKWVKQSSGKQVPVVQAYAYTKYLGMLHIIFDKDGEIKHLNGNPILLDNTVPLDKEVETIVAKYSDEVNSKNSVLVGESLRFLDGEECRRRECTIGNLIADSMLEYVRAHPDQGQTCIHAALIQSGTIRASIDRPEKPFNTTVGDWLTVLPFASNLTILTMNGSILLKALEHSVDSWRAESSSGQFLQMSGLKVVYDLFRPPASRVIEVQATNDCEKLELEDVNESFEYNVIMPSFLAEGGDDYPFFLGLPSKLVPFSELECVFEYFDKHSPVEPHITKKIVLINEEVSIDELSKAPSFTCSPTALIIVIFIFYLDVFT